MDDLCYLTCETVKALKARVSALERMGDTTLADLKATRVKLDRARREGRLLRRQRDELRAKLRRAGEKGGAK